jgi:hypothetical protein
MQLNTTGIVPVIVKALQEQQSQIGDLQVQNSNLIAQSDILNLKTEENISTVGELQTSVDTNLSLISGEIQNLKDQAIQQNSIIATLQAQIDELKQLNNLELNVAQIEANTIDIEYLKTLLGISDTSTPGDVSILGRLEAEGVVAGAFTVKVSDADRPTIGTNYIGAPKNDELGGVIDDGRTYFVKTKAVSKASRIFVTPKDLTDQPIVVMEIKEGEGFTVAVKNVLAENLHFDWLIVNESSAQTTLPAPNIPTTTAPEIPATTAPVIPATTAPAVTTGTTAPESLVTGI